MSIELAPLDPSDEQPSPGSFTVALEHAYYQRDIEALKRIAHKAERELMGLKVLVKALRATLPD